VVIANAALGIRCIYPEKSLLDCVAEARESLENKKALAAFKKLMNL
jgi:anthranilate phosphoribosyltransferase